MISPKWAYANYVCDELGLDTISAGVVCSWAIECYEKGPVGQGETIGREVTSASAIWNRWSICSSSIARRDGSG